MTNGARISVVTISYNQSRYLRQAIESVLGQGDANLDYIIVDPGSTDGSREIIAEYAGRVTAILERDDGPADGLNRGFAAATGDIFGYVNADDMLLPGSLARVRAAFADESIDVICGNGLQIDRDGATTRRIYTSRFNLTSMAHGAMTFVQQANFFRRRAFDQAGGFNAANRTCWDGELLVDMALAGARVVNVPDALGAFRLYDETITGSGRMAVQMKADLARISAKALGRPAARRDTVLAPLYRLTRWVTHPRGFLEGLRSRVAAR